MVASGMRGELTQLAADFEKWWWVSAASGFLAFTLYNLRQNKAVELHLQVFGWAVLVVTTVGTVVFVKGIASYRPSFESLCEDLSQRMTPGSKVVAPQSLWLGLYRYDFRDIGGIIWYRLLTGEKDLTRPLKEFQPDYMILTRGLVGQIGRLNALRKAKNLQGPTGLFPWPHQVLAVMDVGPIYGGQLALIENKWPSKSKRP